ncbi:hypothetical protein M3661_29570 [Paenibacillus sp. MER 180]|uniref:hypothetical protein n=1 Tax=Paenibacillus sp. MER 180 TaxID=2939570 RepID=UPI00203FDB54|nr:hypothetical protein [Paenibacillus sp. MER 180]MCM3294239.1 hypothetical protein [Paenibacillus sp. MER 180]
MNKLTDEQLKELQESYRGECKWAADPEHVRTLLQEVERMKEEIEWMKMSLLEAKNLMNLSYFIQAQIIVEQAIQRIQEGTANGISKG